MNESVDNIYDEVMDQAATLWIDLRYPPLPKNGQECLVAVDCKGVKQVIPATYYDGTGGDIPGFYEQGFPIARHGSVATYWTPYPSYPEELN